MPASIEEFDIKVRESSVDGTGPVNVFLIGGTDNGELVSPWIGGRVSARPNESSKGTTLPISKTKVDIFESCYRQGSLIKKLR